MSISKAKIFLFLLLFTYSFTFSKAENQKDSISNHFLKQINKHHDSNTDSTYHFARQLIKHYKKISNDSLLIRTHQNFGISFKSNNLLDSALYQYKIALDLARTNNFPSLIARSQLLIGNVYSSRSNFTKAITHYKIALNLSQHYKYPKSEAMAYIQIGHIYSEQANFQMALEIYLKAYRIVESNNYQDLKFGALFNIANIYILNKQWKIGIEKLNELLLHANTSKDHYYEASVINNNLGTAYEALGQYKTALSYYLKSLELTKNIKTKEGIGNNYHNLGSIYYWLSEYDLAIDYIEKSLVIARKNTSKLDFVYNYECLAKIYLKQKKYDKALDLLTRATNIAKELNVKSKIIDLAKFKTEYYFIIGELLLAEKAFTEYDSLKDSFIKNEKSEQLIQMQTLYETEKKEKENELLKTQNQLSALNLEKQIEHKNQITIGLIGALFLLIIIIVLLRNRTIANKVNEEINIKLEDSNEKLQVINSTKDKFFSIIAHDLRSPLGAILSFSNLIEDECTSSKEVETVAEYNNYLNQSAHNLNSLLENLLEWSKSQLGNIKYQAETCDLSEIVLDNIEIQKLRAKEKSIEITTKLDKAIKIRADINMIDTVIRNLLSNAIKFSFPKSEIIVYHKIEGNFIHLSVQDQGMGISQSQQKKLFKIDSNLSTLGTNNETGTGLGLILCKEFVEKNGGRIWIDSEEDKGATFTFTIPLKIS